MSNYSHLSRRTYLGDSVYAGHDGHHVLLWLSDGITESHAIALEPEVLSALARYAECVAGTRALGSGEGEKQ